MSEKEEINIVETLMNIQTSVSRIDERTKKIDSTYEKADKAYSLAKKNEENINGIQEQNKWTMRTAITAIVIPFGLVLVEYFITKV